MINYETYLIAIVMSLSLKTFCSSILIYIYPMYFIVLILCLTYYNPKHLHARMDKDLRRPARFDGVLTRV